MHTEMRGKRNRGMGGGVVRGRRVLKCKTIIVVQELPDNFNNLLFIIFIIKTPLSPPFV